MLPLVKCNLADSYKPHIIRLFDKNYFVLVNRRDRQIYSKFIDNKHSDKNVIICMGYSILGYFCPWNFAFLHFQPVLPRFEFAQTRLCLLWFALRHSIRPVLNLPVDNEGERSKNKSGANIYLYTVYFQWHHKLMVKKCHFISICYHFKPKSVKLPKNSRGIRVFISVPKVLKWFKKMWGLTIYPPD